MLGFALSTTTAAGVVYLARQRKHLSLAPYPHVMVFSVIFLISWSGLSSLVDTHTAHRGAKRGRRIIRKKTRPKYMRVVLYYICSGISLISFCCFSSSFFFLCLSLSRPYRNYPSLLSLSLSITRKLDLFQMIYSFRFAISYAATVSCPLSKRQYTFTPFPIYISCICML